MADETVLSRTQRNAVFTLITKVKLDPADFRWGTRQRKSVGDTSAETLSHVSTDALIEFSHNDRGFWVAWWPSQHRGRQYQPAQSWNNAIPFVDDWLNAVAADHNAPDLWAEISKRQTISNATEREAEYQKPFSPAELKRLETALPEIERYITTTQPLNEDQKKVVHQRFAYLLEAAKHGARKIDWLNIFVAQVVSMVMVGLLDARVYGAVMGHAATVLNALFQFGLKLLN